MSDEDIFGKLSDVDDSCPVVDEDELAAALIEVISKNKRGGAVKFSAGVVNIHFRVDELTDEVHCTVGLEPGDGNINERINALRLLGFYALGSKDSEVVLLKKQWGGRPYFDPPFAASIVTQIFTEIYDCVQSQGIEISIPGDD